jgi:ribosome-associated toxin RatA of RatAB toxin-antitoxin module
MKEVSGLASAAVAAPAKRCFALLAAVEEYPRWIGEYVRAVEVLARDRHGRPIRAVAEVHVEESPFGKDFELIVEIETESTRTLRMTRIPNDPDDMNHLEARWRLKAGRQTTIAFEFGARISFLPALLPLGDAGDVIAAAVLEAAASALGDELSPAPAW